MERHIFKARFGVASHQWPSAFGLSCSHEELYYDCIKCNRGDMGPA